VVTVQVGDGNGGRAYEINGALSTASTTITIQ
jgi:hypothetical protein